jgi:hypothetical protein
VVDVGDEIADQPDAGQHVFPHSLSSLAQSDYSVTKC